MGELLRRRMGDWNTESTVIGNRGARAAKSTTAINAARRRGDAVSTEQKYGAGQNKHSVTSMNTAKLDQETEELKHDKVSLDVGKLIMNTSLERSGFYFELFSWFVSPKKKIFFFVA